MALDHQPTDMLAADQLANLVRPIAAGEPPYLFQRIDETGRLFDLKGDYVSGGYLILVFVPGLENDNVNAALKNYEKLGAKFDAANAKVVIITAQSHARTNKSLKRKLGLGFPVITDPGGLAFAAYGLHKNGTSLAPTQMRSVVLTPYRQIRCFWDIEMTKNHAEKAAALIDQAKLAEEASWSAPHPPVLIVPNVFSKEECASLIDDYEKSGDLHVIPPKSVKDAAGVKIPVYEYDRQDRVDHILTDPARLAFLDERLKERVFPAIQKAFAFSVSRRENLTLARYVGARSGVEIGHRDNVAGTTHRRFALSVSLNDGYEDGGVVFREYSNRGYRLEPGSALVFSSSLLHEVQETKGGVRYNLLSHLYNDASAPIAART